MTEDIWSGKLLRPGRDNGRVLYLYRREARADESSLGTIGMMDTKELAEEVARRWNASGPEDTPASVFPSEAGAVTVAEVYAEHGGEYDAGWKYRYDQLRDEKDKRIAELEDSFPGRWAADREWSQRRAKEQAHDDKLIRELNSEVQRLTKKRKNDKEHIKDLEMKLEERDRRIKNMVGELTILYGENYDDLHQGPEVVFEEQRTESLEKQIKELSEVLMHEFGNFFDRSEGAVDMAIRLLRGFKK